MIDEYFTALEARIEAGQGLSGRVFDTVRLDANGGLIRDNYVILYSPVPVDVPESRYMEIPTMSGAVDFEADIRVVGVTAATVRVMLGAVKSQLIGHKLAVTGRAPAPLRLGVSGRTVPDTSVKPFLYYADMSVEWTSRP